MSKTNFAEPKPISFGELVDVRKFELQSCLPNMMAIVHDPLGKKKEARVYSLPVMKRSMFKVNTDE